MITPRFTVTLPFASSTNAREKRVSTHAKPASHFGDKYLVYSSYPNGLPVYNIDEATAEKVIHAVNPSLAINKRQYVYGRIIHENRMVGTVLYPIHEQDAIELEGMLRDSLMTQDQKDERINQHLPKLAAKDPGPFHIYDLSTKQLIVNPKGLKESVNKSPLPVAAKAVPAKPQVVAPPVPSTAVSPPPVVKPLPPVVLPSSVAKPSPPQPASPISPYPVTAAPNTPTLPTSFVPVLPVPLTAWQPLPQNYYQQVSAPPYPFS